MTADQPPASDPLFTTRWVHVFEEDTGEGAVYRPDDRGIPLSRRPREQLMLGADGRATLLTPGPDDRLVERAVTWRDQDDDRPTATDADLRIVDRSPDRLVVRLNEVWRG